MWVGGWLKGIGVARHPGLTMHFWPTRIHSFSCWVNSTGQMIFGACRSRKPCAGPRLEPIRGQIGRFAGVRSGCPAEQTWTFIGPMEMSRSLEYPRLGGLLAAGGYGLALVCAGPNCRGHISRPYRPTPTYRP